MSSELQLDVCHLSRWRRHLVNAYEVKAGLVFLTGYTVWSMPECFKVVHIPYKALCRCSALPLPSKDYPSPSNSSVLILNPLVTGEKVMVAYCRRDDLESHLWADCLYTGISSGPSNLWRAHAQLLLCMCRSSAADQLLMTWCDISRLL